MKITLYVCVHSSELNPDLHFINLYFSAQNAAVSVADIRKPNRDMLLMDAAGVPRTNKGKYRSAMRAVIT